MIDLSKVQPVSVNGKPPKRKNRTAPTHRAAQNQRTVRAETADRHQAPTTAFDGTETFGKGNVSRELIAAQIAKQDGSGAFHPENTEHVSVDDLKDRYMKLAEQTKREPMPPTPLEIGVLDMDGPFQRYIQKLPQEDAKKKRSVDETNALSFPGITEKVDITKFPKTLIEKCAYNRRFDVEKALAYAEYLNEIAKLLKAATKIGKAFNKRRIDWEGLRTDRLHAEKLLKSQVAYSNSLTDADWRLIQMSDIQAEQTQALEELIQDRVDKAIAAKLKPATAPKKSETAK